MSARHFAADQIEELRTIGVISEVVDCVPMVLIENAQLPIHLKAPEGLSLLLCPHPRDGYSTRLFFSERLTGVRPTQPNWRDVMRVADRLWHVYSFQGVPSSLRLAQILSAHLGELG